MNLLNSIKNINGMSGLLNSTAATSSAAKTIDQQLQESKKLKVSNVKVNFAANCQCLSSCAFLTEF